MKNKIQKGYTIVITLENDLEKRIPISKEELPFWIELLRIWSEISKTNSLNKHEEDIISLVRNNIEYFSNAKITRNKLVIIQAFLTFVENLVGYSEDLILKTLIDFEISFSEEEVSAAVVAQLPKKSEAKKKSISQMVIEESNKFKGKYYEDAIKGIREVAIQYPLKESDDTTKVVNNKKETFDKSLELTDYLDSIFKTRE